MHSQTFWTQLPLRIIVAALAVCRTLKLRISFIVNFLILARSAMYNVLKRSEEE